MSVNYSIETILNTSFRIENIQTVLIKGTTLGLKYHDHKEGVLYGLAPVLHEEEAAKKIINAHYNKTEEGSCVYATCKKEGFFIWFYESDFGQLEVHIGVFSNPKIKLHFIDLAYYISLLLKLCEDFCILSLKTDIF